MICCTYLIECDGCAASISSQLSAADLDQAARDNGWHLGRDGDHCPTCAPTSGAWALVERAQAGDMQAFGQLYDRYLDTIFRFVYFRVGNRQLAEDLTADTFARALRRIGSLQWQGRDPGAWLVTIARNLVADHFKSGRYRLEVTCGDVLDGEKEDKRPGPEAATVDYLVSRELMAAILQLAAEQRDCIILRYLRGYNVAETAEALGINIGAAKALQYRAVRALGRLVPLLGDGQPPKPGAYIPVQERRQTTPCEGCGAPLANGLAVCRKPACLTADLADTARTDQLCEATT